MIKAISLLVSVVFMTAVAQRDLEWEGPAYPEVNNLSGVTLWVSSDSISGTGVTATVTNNSPYDLTFGAFYAVERLENGSWRPVPELPSEHERAWNSIGYSVDAGGTWEFDPINWQYLYGELAPGQYRLIKDGIVGSRGNITTYYFAAEFTVG